MSNISSRSYRSTGAVIVVSILFGLWYVTDRLMHYHVYDERVVAFLLDSNDRLNKAAVIAAVQTRFPSGTLSSEILKFADQQGSHCSISEGTHICMVGIGGAFCIATVVILTFPDGQLAQPVDVAVLEDGC